MIYWNELSEYKNEVIIKEVCYLSLMAYLEQQNNVGDNIKNQLSKLINELLIRLEGN